ncbi:MAG: glycosyltransferase family 2 protein [Candidatus Pacebacteria bacterium]|nr:glycosyltransferase family 2 protein [Mesotoga sp.]MDD5606671.1 glycosyltransferase family 2 protein [Candidatus Paceibacterota bacterium]
MPNHLVSIIIVNWNGKKHLSYCLPSLKKINYPNVEIIIVDNGSTDQSVEYIKNNFPSAKIILNKTNMGFAEGNNIGFKKAKGKYVLFLNNDTIVTPNFLKKLVNAIEENNKIAVVQPKIILSPSKKLQAGGDFLTDNGFLYHYGFGKNPDDPKYNRKIEIFSACGACMLVRSSVIKKIGLFDPDFFCYFEESDFCWRVCLAGYKLLYVPESIIYHKGSSTSRKLGSKFTQYHSFKNRICSLIKNLEKQNLVKTLFLHLLFCFLSFVTLVTTGKFPEASSICKAWYWNFSHLNETLSKRRYIQGKIRKISDKKLMAKLKKSPGLKYFFYLFYGLEHYSDLDIT